MNIDWKIKHFVDLNQYELYDVFALRTNIFVVEQNCPYPELDGKDKQCFHLIGEYEGEVIATARILPAGVSFPEVSIGRVAIRSDFRGKELGHVIMKNCIEFIDNEYDKCDIRISAQSQLQNYYQKHGFNSTGKEYLEDGIPHVEMLFEPLM